MGTRKYFLDWLRVIAFALLIVFHVGCLYAGWDYNLKSPHAPDAAAEWALSTFAPWRMPLLFLISGVASAFLIDKLGAPGFARDRVRRLAPVILFAMFVIIPPQVYVELIAEGATQIGYLEFWSAYVRADQTLAAPAGKTFPTWDHLWFVVYLLAYTLALALFARRSASRPSRAPLWLLLAAPPAALVLTSLTIEHIAPITHALIDDWGGHMKWIAMFATGIICARHDAFWAFLERWRFALLALALILFAAQTANHAIWLTGRIDPAWDGVIYAAIDGLFAWAAICTLCGFAARHLNKSSTLLTHLNEAILPVYVLHQPILLIAAFFLFLLRLPVGAEAGALFAITLAGSFAIYELLVRPFNPMRFLFGLKPHEGLARAKAA